jgi:murein DD-endopeptidase MepM/ murein hydrolase activator NlpD
METTRMKRKVGKVEQTGKKLQQSQPDGIVGKKTRDELDEWIKNDWVKPIAPLRHGEVDDNGVENGKGKKDSEEHHKGSPVSDIQQTLKAIGAYAGAIDGWFWDIMKDAIKLLQVCGEKGEFYDAKGNKVILEEKDRLKGHSPSVEVMDAKKIELAKKAEEMGLVVIQKDKCVFRFPLDNEYRDNGYHTSPRSFGSSRNGGARHHAGCDLYAPVGSKIYSMADGIIEDYRNFYGQTYVLVINHDGKIFRYGEIQPPAANHGYTKDIPSENVRKGLAVPFTRGMKIKRGQHIAYVGQLRLLNKNTSKIENYKQSMLHIEIFSGDGHGELTEPDNKKYTNVPARNYMRRSDLLAPTQIIDNSSLE